MGEPEQRSIAAGPVLGKKYWTVVPHMETLQEGAKQSEKRRRKIASPFVKPGRRERAGGDFY
jgi:hypothetical protein